MAKAKTAKAVKAAKVPETVYISRPTSICLLRGRITIFTKSWAHISL
ncbi:MAG: hypothetical protein ACLURV_09975 [Gallintestinimicrobium sp.]